VKPKFRQRVRYFKTLCLLIHLTKKENAGAILKRRSNRNPPQADNWRCIQSHMSIKHAAVLVVVHVDGVTLHRLTAATNEPNVHPQIIYEYGEPRWNDIVRSKLCSSANFPPQIPLELTRARTRISAARVLRLTA
jgi:hypothetical protein